MTVSSINARSTQMLQSLVNLRSQLDDLTRQLSSGQKSTTFAGLGIRRGVTVSLRAQLSAITGYDSTAQTAMTRINLANTALQGAATVVTSVKAAMIQGTNVSGIAGVSQTQTTAKFSLDQLTGLLNTQAGNSYIFGGKATDRPPVETSDHILNGDGARAGLVQVINERKQADLGASGLGRVTLTNPTTSSLDISEDAVSPFGFKLASVSSTLTNATVTGPTGSPAGISADLSGGNPNDGDSITLRFNMPDGSSQSLTLTATTASPAADGKFTIGATPDDTTANLTAALYSALGTMAKTSLTAASAVQASNGFFDNPPARVDGPPFDSATALKSGTPADTVIWYTGDTGSDPARQTATALVDPSLSVGYGTRASEQGLRSVVQNVATLAAVTISSTDPNALDLSQALNSRLTEGLNGRPGQQKLSDIQVDLGNAQVSIKAAQDRHKQQNGMLQDYLQKIEGVSDTEVGAQILALQTRLQASMQVTAMTYQNSLVNYLK